MTITKTKLAVAAALLALTGSAAMAKTKHVARESAPLVQREVSMPRVIGEGYYDGDRQFNVDRFDHASSPYAGGM
jgi:hypothetical protein